MNLIEAPSGRYRIEERGGRLIVIDTLTGAIGDSAVQAAARDAERRSGAAHSRSAVQAAGDVQSAGRSAAAPPGPPGDAALPTRPGAIDPDPGVQMAGHWLGNRRDARGRLILAVKGRPPVALDRAQARRLGLPLLVMAGLGVVTLVLALLFLSLVPLLAGGFILFRLWSDWYGKTRDALLDQGEQPARG